MASCCSFLMVADQMIAGRAMAPVQLGRDGLMSDEAFILE
jgi:hypothetical protein